LADNEGEIVRLLEALNGVDQAETSGRSADNDAANWVSRALRWGAEMGLSPDISALILSETLNEIRAASSPASNARGPKKRAGEKTAASGPQVSEFQDAKRGKHLDVDFSNSSGP
jgi:hypothetical protein